MRKRKNTHGASASSKDAIISTLGEVLGAYPGNRGPRQATHLAILNAGLQLDDQSASIDYPGTDFRQKFNGQSARGAVLIVTPPADAATTIRFKFSVYEKVRTDCAAFRIGINGK